MLIKRWIFYDIDEIEIRLPFSFLQIFLNILEYI